MAASPSEPTGWEGQIIINGSNLATPGTWNGNITVGTTVLGPTQSGIYQAPYYGVVSADLGGGSIGLARFNLHGTDCWPVNGASLQFSPTTTVYLAHYGPVFWDPQYDPVEISWRYTGTTEWTVLSPDEFSIQAGADPRDIVVTALTTWDFSPGFDYRIRPVPGVLRCTDVSGNPDVYPYEYILHGY